MSHTKTPWEIGATGDGKCRIWADKKYLIAATNTSEYLRDEEMKANAAHIVHCVNSHDELVRQRDDLLETLKAVLNVSSAYIPSDAVYEFESGLVVNVKDIIEKAKNKCKGGKK